MAAIWIFVNYLARKGKNYLPRRTTDRKAFEEDLHKDLIEALRKFGVSVLETSNPQRSLGVEGVAEDADAQEDAADTDADADADAATAAVPADLDNDRVNIHLAALDRDLYVMLVSYVKKRGLTPNGNFVANGLFDIVSMFDKAQRDHTRNPLSPDDVSFETEEKILELAIYCWQRRSRYAGIDFKQVRINFSFHWYGYPTTSLKSLSLTEALESARQEQASAFDSFKKAVDKYHSFLEGSELKASIHKLPIGYISDPAATAAQGLGHYTDMSI
ncbi:hypothetical protein CXG81DRAFT_21369 [Caulochytrium protostelioides]|uniref:Uncharacterized protein n=1 Tax=Caulochytrium protostelioides TaxID=1555241 RepID=A0A4P9WY33_9FUNG|nr:hypothetical protein CXG81DRAFT_21369 [Caulochytrium protostelioides]|eukprot:RKO98391.1 hypothetical protein CXG81DRAFT_21369 [Caulochytrium protostelioides]